MTSCKTNRFDFFHILDRWTEEREHFPMKNQKIFLITGVSSGLGRAFAIESLNAGYRVVGTLRRAELVPEFEAQKPGLGKARTPGLFPCILTGALAGAHVGLSARGSASQT